MLYYICPKCKVEYEKREGSFSFTCRRCGTLLRMKTNKRIERANKLAKAQLKRFEEEETRALARKQSQPLIRAHDYPHFFGKKTFGV